VSETLITIVAGLVMLIGLAGVVLPVLPGAVLIWGAALGYGLLAGWGESGGWLFGLITLLGLAGLGAEIWVTGTGAKMAGASLWSLLAGLGLGLVGMVFGSLPGAVAGLVLGTLTVEYLRRKDWDQAVKASLGTLAGYGLSYGVKLVIGLMMIAAWLAWVVIG
jgi:uncharacterized protein YqgC (DUF456 family)